MICSHNLRDVTHLRPPLNTKQTIKLQANVGREIFVFLFFYRSRSQDGGKSLQEGMEENATIRFMDLRLTEVGQESEYCINQLLKRNREQQYKENN